MTSTSLTNEGELQDLYRELILDHARTPRHFGKLDTATHSAEGINPLCGDKLTLYLRIADDCIEEAAFEGCGCAISMASASLLTEAVDGIKTRRAADYVTTFTAHLTAKTTKEAPLPDDVRLQKLMALQGVREYPARVKCATLAWHTLRSALQNKPTSTTTE